ncbi:MAG: hypothetical protein HY552_05885 [Elusimicrobia bacterium]|nr:hypothetical protein [Elusimicrobiota bacterium]
MRIPPLGDARKALGAAGFALLAGLFFSPAAAQLSAPYDPDFAPPPEEQAAPAPTQAPAPEPATAPEPPSGLEPLRPAQVLPAAPAAPFLLRPRADAGRVLGAEAAAPAAAPAAGYSIERFQRVRDAVDRGENPGEAATLGPGYGAPPLLPELAVSTSAPKPPPPEVELPSYGTSLSVTGRKVIGFSFSEKRFANSQTATGRPKTTNLIDITQQLQLRMQGKVGPKITVNVDYDDTKQDQQDISVVYQGDPNETIQNVAFGDIDLSLPATEFVSYNKQLFGIRADVKYKGFQFSAIASRTKGTTKSRQFLGNSQFVSIDIPDTAYLRRQHYDVAFGVAARLPIRAGSERVVLATQENGVVALNVNQQTLTVDDILCQDASCPTFPTISSFTGVFTTLVAGQDYTIDYNKGVVFFRNALQPQFVAAVDYIDALGNHISVQASTTAESANTGSGRLKLIKTPADLPIVSSATEAGFNRELKTHYSIGQTQIVRDNGRGNFILRVLDPTTRDEVGSALNPVQKYPDTIEVDFENGVFNLLRPFSVSNSSPTEPDPDLYAPTPIGRRTLHVEYNFRFKTFNLEPNLVVQSEIVILDGIKLARNVDYFVDYDAGFVTFFNPDRITSSSEIDISYEVAPFAGAANNDTLLGGRVSHQFNEHVSLGSTILYDAGVKSQTTPQITELAKSLLVYDFDAQVKRYQLGERLVASLSAEFAQSRQNLNLNPFALIDNMEGIKQETAAPLLAAQWQIASNPGGAPADPNQLTLNSEDFNVLQINPSAQANAQDTQKVLDFNYNFSVANATSEVSIVYPFSISGVDLSQASLLQITMLGDGSNNQLNFHLGAVNEDSDAAGGTTLTCANGQVLSRAPKTEDLNCNGLLDPGEDIGWIYQVTGSPSSARYGADNGIVDAQDLDRNGRLDAGDLSGGDFGYVCANGGASCTSSSAGQLYDATSNSTVTAVSFTGPQWHTLQIPLNISTANAGLWTSVKQIRVSIRRPAGGAASGVLKFAKIAVIGNTWQRGRAGDPATSAAALASESLLVTPVNNVDDPAYSPIFSAGGEASQVFNDLYGSLSSLQRQNNTSNLSEQALELQYSGLVSSASVYTKRAFTRAVDISQHRFLNFLVFGNADGQSLNNGTTFFLRAGNDADFFEVRVPLNFTGWKKIRVKQVDTAGNSVMSAWQAETPGAVVVSSGSPNLQQVAALTAGIRAGNVAALSGVGGTVYLNEIHLAQPVARTGSAAKLQADFEAPGWGTFGFKHRAVDRNFQTPTSVVSNQDRTDQSAYLNLTRLAWFPLSLNVARTITDTPSTVQTGSLSNLVNLLQQGKVTTWNGAAQGNLSYGAYPRVSLAYARNRIEYDLLTRRDDRQAYTTALQYGVPWRTPLLPRTVDASYGFTRYDVGFESAFARSQPGDFNTQERGLSYGLRLTFAPWTGSSFNPSWSMTKTTEKRQDFTSGAEVDSAYPKSFQQTVGFASNYRLTSWLNPQVSYQVSAIENNLLSVTTITVKSSTFSFNPGDIKTVNRMANGAVSLPLDIGQIVPRSKLFRSLNVVSGYQLQDGDVWSNVEKGLDTRRALWLRTPLRPSGPAAQLANQTLRDTYSSTQRWSPLEGYALTGRKAAWRTLSISNNYILAVQRTNVTGTTSKTISRTLPDAVASISQLERLWHVERWASNVQMNLKYARRQAETVGASQSVENAVGGDLRSLLLRKYDVALSYNLRINTNRDLLVDANTQRIRHEDGSAQATFDARKFRLTPKVDYVSDVTTLGSGVQSQNVSVVTPSLLARADLSLPSGLRLPGSARPFLFTNRVIWTTTLSMAFSRSPVTDSSNSRLLSLGTSADYEIAKNLRMTLNGSAQRFWSRIAQESFLSYTMGTNLTFQF